MTRKLLILSLAVLMALPNVVFASGGANPGLERNEKLTGPTFSATVVVDAQKNNLPEDTRWATVRIKKGSSVSGVVFTTPSTFLFTKYGCTLVAPEPVNVYPAYADLTEVRFLHVPLISWMPGGKIAELFRAVAIEIDSGTGCVLVNGICVAVPMITSVENAACVPPIAETGTLSFEAVIQFKVSQQ